MLVPYWVENDGPLGRIVRLEGLDVVLDTFRRDRPHVEDKSTTAQVGQVGGFFGVVGHDRAGAYREGHVGGKVLDDLHGGEGGDIHLCQPAFIRRMKKQSDLYQGIGESYSVKMSSEALLTKLVILCDKGVFLPTAATASAVFAQITLPTKSLDTAAGSSAAMTALTTAMPSRLLCGEALCERTALAFVALTPPMQTVGVDE